MAFDRSAAPSHGQPGGDRVLVAAQTPDERVQRRLILGVDRSHPPFEISPAPLAHDVGERADVPGQRGQFRADCQDRIKAHSVIGSEGVGVGHDPADDFADGRRLGWRDRDVCESAEGLQVVAHQLLAALVAAGLDLLEQLGCVGAALVPPPVQVGLVCLEKADSVSEAVVDQ